MEKESLFFIGLVVVVCLGTVFIINPDITGYFIKTHTSFGELSQTLGDYLGKEIKIRGEYGRNTPMEIHFLLDEGKRHIKFLPENPDDYEIGKTYTVRGVVNEKKRVDCYNYGTKKACYNRFLYYYVKEGGEEFEVDGE